jgi:hypothetical protein
MLAAKQAGWNLGVEDIKSAKGANCKKQCYLILFFSCCPSAHPRCVCQTLVVTSHILELPRHIHFGSMLTCIQNVSIGSIHLNWQKDEWVKKGRQWENKKQKKTGSTSVVPAFRTLDWLTSPSWEGLGAQIPAASASPQALWGRRVSYPGGYKLRLYLQS